MNHAHARAYAQLHSMVFLSSINARLAVNFSIFNCLLCLKSIHPDIVGTRSCQVNKFLILIDSFPGRIIDPKYCILFSIIFFIHFNKHFVDTIIRLHIFFSIVPGFRVRKMDRIE